MTSKELQKSFTEILEPLEDKNASAVVLASVPEDKQIAIISSFLGGYERIAAIIHLTMCDNPEFAFAVQAAFDLYQHGKEKR